MNGLNSPTTHARPKLEPAGQKRLLRAIDLQPRLSLATIVISICYHAAYFQLWTNSSQDSRLRKSANSALMKDLEREHRNNRSHSHTCVGHISSKHSLGDAQVAWSFFQPLHTSGSGKLTAIASHICERLSICWYWHPSWTRPLLRNYVVSFEGLTRSLTDVFVCFYLVCLVPLYQILRWCIMYCVPERPKFHSLEIWTNGTLSVL